MSDTGVSVFFGVGIFLYPHKKGQPQGFSRADLLILILDLACLQTGKIVLCLGSNNSRQTYERYDIRKRHESVEDIRQIPYSLYREIGTDEYCL